MIAAVSPDRDSALRALKLVLSLRASQQNLSEPMSDYFSSIVRQSLELANEPTSLSKHVTAEALSLAVRIKANDELKARLTELLDRAANEAETAQSALNILESSFDPRRESAHFSPAIYAAI